MRFGRGHLSNGFYSLTSTVRIADHASNMPKQSYQIYALSLLTALAGSSSTWRSAAQETTPSNDAFANALVLQGSAFSDTADVAGATVEPGEPEHLDGQSCKSLWWQWQAPVNGSAGVMQWSGSATNVLFAVYTGPSVEALTLVAKGTGRADFAAIGGTTYAIAAPQFL